MIVLHIPDPPVRPSRARPTYARVLQYIRAHKNVHPSDLVHEFNATRPRIAKYLAGLLKKGLIVTDSTGTSLFPKS